VFALIGHVSITKLLDIFTIPLPLQLRTKVKVYFSILFSFTFLIILYGLSTLKILAIISLHYYITKSRFNDNSLILTWAFDVFIMVFNNRIGRFEYGDFIPILSWMVEI
jgi:hypothetical protein